MIDVIKARRLMIDRLIRLDGKYFEFIETSRHLNMAKARLGLLLTEIGSESPYEVPTMDATKIPQSADVYEFTEADEYKFTTVAEKLTLIYDQRKGIRNVISELDRLPNTRNTQIAVEHLEDAVIEYGFLLAFMRDKAIKKSQKENQGSYYDSLDESD